MGMDAHTGQYLDGNDHLRQSIADILATPIGSRVMRRDYGSLLPELVDQPLNGATLVRAFAVSAHALMLWEPRLVIEKIRFHSNREGQLVTDIIGRRRDANGQSAVNTLSVPLRMRARQ